MNLTVILRYDSYDEKGYLQKCNQVFDVDAESSEEAAYFIVKKCAWFGDYERGHNPQIFRRTISIDVFHKVHHIENIAANKMIDRELENEKEEEKKEEIQKLERKLAELRGG